jgi:hypothetical protein
MTNASVPPDPVPSDAASSWRLSPEDAVAIDALLSEGLREQSAGVTGTPRQTAANRCLRLLEDYPVTDADDLLVHATLARIERHDRDATHRMKIRPAADELVGRRRLRLSDFVSVAAMILVGVGATIPMLNYVRRTSMETACANNLRIAGGALHQYATDHEGNLPMVAGLSDPLAPFSWKTLRNSENLNLLSDLGYCEHGHLNCPGHAEGGPAYSFQVQVPGRRVPWGVGPVIAVIGDRNPVLDAARSGRTVEATLSTANHGGRGQNILCSDGFVQFTKSPMLTDKDNVWLPRTRNGEERFDTNADFGDPADSCLMH